MPKYQVVVAVEIAVSVDAESEDAALNIVRKMNDFDVLAEGEVTDMEIVGAYDVD